MLPVGSGPVSCCASCEHTSAWAAATSGLEPGAVRPPGACTPEWSGLEERFRGTYALDSVLGRGGMGLVIAARRLADDAPVALKLFTPDAAPAIAERFEREADLLERLDHPNVVRLIERGACGGLPYIAMELVTGGSLSARLDGGAQLPVGEAVRIALEILAGLAHVHELGILHRDIKPANILLDASGRARIADLGLSRALDSKTLTEAGSKLGTPRYISPEVLRGAKPTPASDVYAVATILYEALGGCPPFAGTSMPELFRQILEVTPAPLAGALPDVPPELDRAIAAAMRKEPRARTATARAFTEALRAAMPQPRPKPQSRGTGKPSRPIAPASAPAVSPPARLVPIAILAALGLFVAVALGVRALRVAPSVAGPSLAATIAPSGPPRAAAAGRAARVEALENLVLQQSWSQSMEDLDQAAASSDFAGGDARARSLARTYDEVSDSLLAMLTEQSADPAPPALLMRELTLALAARVRRNHLTSRILALERARQLEMQSRDKVATWLGSLTQSRPGGDAEVSLLERALTAMVATATDAARTERLGMDTARIVLCASLLGHSSRLLKLTAADRQRASRAILAIEPALRANGASAARIADAVVVCFGPPFPTLRDGAADAARTRAAIEALRQRADPALAARLALPPFVELKPKPEATSAPAPGR